MINFLSGKQESENTVNPCTYGDFIAGFPIAPVIVNREGNIPDNVELNIGPQTIRNVIDLLYERKPHRKDNTLGKHWDDFFSRYGRKLTVTKEYIHRVLELGILPYVKGSSDILFDEEMLCSAVRSYQNYNSGKLPNERLMIPDWIYDSFIGGSFSMDLDSRLAFLIRLSNLGTEFVQSYGCYLMRHYTAEYIKIAEIAYTSIGCPEWLDVELYDMNLVIMYLANLKLNKTAPMFPDIPGEIIEKYWDSGIVVSSLTEAVTANANNLALCPVTMTESQKYAVSQAALNSTIPLENYEIAEQLGLSGYSQFIRASMQFIGSMDLVTLPNDCPIIQNAMTINGLVALLKRHDGETQIYQILIHDINVHNSDIVHRLQSMYNLRFRLEFDLQLKLIRALYQILEEYDQQSELTELDTEVIRNIDNLIRSIVHIDVDRWIDVFPPILNIVKISRTLFALRCKTRTIINSNGVLDPLYVWYPAAEIPERDFTRILTICGEYVPFNYRPFRGKCTSLIECCGYRGEVIYDVIVNKGQVGYLLDLPSDLQILIATALVDEHRLLEKKRSIFSMIHLRKSKKSTRIH